MKYSIIPLLALASSVLAAPALVYETSVVVVTADQQTSIAAEPTASASAAPKVGYVYEVVVSKLVEIKGDTTNYYTSTYTNTIDPASATTASAVNKAASTTAQEVSSEETSSTAQETSTSIPAAANPTTTLTTQTSSTQEQTSTTSASETTSSSASKATSSFASAILKAHNEKRAECDASALTWSNTLAEYAQAYADKYDCSGTLTHSGGQYGENLGLGYTTTGAVDAWYNEKSEYDSSSPSASHFTQVVWKSTTQLGCGYKQCGSYWGQYTICSYNPAGNVAGGYSENVSV